MRIELKSIENFLDCKESIIRIEINRCLLNQSNEGIADVIFNRLWIETDILLNKEINKLVDMLVDDKCDYDVHNQIAEFVADEATIKDIIRSDVDIIPVDEIVSYIKQDIIEKTSY